MSVASNPLAKTATEPNPPTEYIIVVRTQVCDCCHTTHSWSETYAHSPLRSRLGMGRPGSEYLRISEPRYRVPIRKREMTPTTVPFCHSCHEPSLANTGTIVYSWGAADLIDPPNYEDPTIINFTKPVQEPKATATSAKPKLTTKDIEELFK